MPGLSGSRGRGGEVLEFRFKNCTLRLADRELVLVSGGRVRRFKYTDVSLVQLKSVVPYRWVILLPAAYILRAVYYEFKDVLPEFFGYVVLAFVLACLAVVVYEFVVERGDYIEIYVSGLRKPLMVKGKREELEKALKTIRRTIRMRR